jgi:orotidine-5'-phosphate decarboxylase
MTPAEAIGKGADYLVIGRPITGAPSPHEAFLRVLAELEES